MNNKKAEQIKVRFVGALKTIRGGEVSLKAAVEAALKANVERSTMVGWAVDAGYSESWTRSLISKVLCDIGQRQNREGQGRETPREAIELAEALTSKYGDAKKAKKILLAAYRSI